MPIDARIALGFQPDQQAQNPLDILARVMQLKNQQAQAPLIDAQVKRATLENKGLEQSQADEQAIKDAINAAGGNAEAAIPGVMKASPKAGIALQKSIAEQGEAELKKQQAKLNLAKAHTEFIGQQLGGVNDQNSYQAALQELQGSGIDVSKMAPQFDPQAVESYRQKGMTITEQLNAKSKQLEDQIKQAAESRAAAKAPLEMRTAEANATAAEQKAAGQEPIQPADKARIDREAEAATETVKHNRETEAAARSRNLMEQRRVQLEGARLNLDKEKAGFDMGGGVSPAAQMAAEGRMDPQTLRSMLRRSPGMVSQIQKIDPNFDEANIDKRFNTLKEFTNTSNGKAGGQALALNTLIHHADLYLQTAEALKNGSFVPGNAIYNKVATMFGAAPPTNAALVARFLAGETGKVATGGVPAEGEIKGILSNLSADASPAGIEGAAKTLLSVAAGRAQPLIEKAKDAKIDNIVHVIGPDAQEILKSRGFDPNTMKQVGGQAADPAFKAYADKYFGGDIQKAAAYNKK